MSQHWQDVLLLAYIAFFGILCAVLIIKEQRLGWALFTKNMAYAVAFGYGAVMLVFPQFAREDIRRWIRVLVALAITWAIYELVSLRVRRWREGRQIRQ